jgi:alpha-glucosidase (family GH31 glycosyl hydrolase)
MFGSSILVAPVVNEKQYFQKVYLPKGSWLDPATELVYEGGRDIIIDAPWWKLPYFFRAGGIIPRRATQQYDNETPLTDLIVDVVVGADGAYTLYLDDGDGFGYEKGEYDEIAFSQSAANNELSVKGVSTNNAWAAKIKSISYRIHNVNASPKSVSTNGRALRLADGKDTAWDGMYAYDAAKKLLTVRVPFTTSAMNVTVRL